MRKSLDSDVIEAALGRVARATKKGVPRQPIRPRPISTVVIPAERFQPDAAGRAGAHALRLLQAHAPDCIVLARALRLPGWERLPTDPTRADELLWRLESGGGQGAGAEARAAHEAYERVVRRLKREPVQDLRVALDDDGFSRPPDDDEALATAGAVGDAIARAADARTLPARIGLELPALDGRTGERALGMLDCAVSTLVDRVRGEAPPIVVAFAGLALPAQVTAVAQVASTLEHRLALKRGAIRLELVIGSADAVFDDEGRVRLPALLAAAAGRCVGVRITGEAAGSAVARDLVRLTAGDLPLTVGEGARAAEDADGAGVLASWAATAERTARNAADGAWCGLDRDASQLPARLAAAYSALRARLPALRDALAEAVRAGRPDDPPEAHAEGQRRLDRVLQAVDCGAVDVSEVLAPGIDPGDLEVGSFRAMLDRRRA